MTLTPQDVEAQVFRQEFRGYNQEDVDSFLDRVRDRIAELLRENDELRARAEQAGAVQVEGEAIDAGLLQRTLLTAQRTADQTVAKAEEEAAAARAQAEQEATRLLAEARQQAGELEQQAAQTVEDARQQAAELLTESEREANQLVEGARRDARMARERAEQELERTRQSLARLQRFREEYRERVRQVIGEHLALLERAEDLPEVPPEALAASDEAQPVPATEEAGRS